MDLVYAGLAGFLIGVAIVAVLMKIVGRKIDKALEDAANRYLWRRT